MQESDRDEIASLTALAEWQRRELDQLRAEAAAGRLVERATGILMERLGCTAADARQQLATLAGQAGMARAEIAADIAGQSLAAAPAARRRAAAADAAIAAAPDAGRLAEALLTEALSAEGAEAAAIWLLAPDGGMELAGEAGFGGREASRWRRITPDMQFLALRVARQDSPIWWPAGRPHGDDSVVIGRRPDGARAVIPLRQAGTCIGALEACWSAPMTAFSASVRSQLTALAGSCVQALTAGLPPATPPYSQAWVFSLLQGLHANVLFARTIRDGHGEPPSLVIGWATPSVGTAGRQLLEVHSDAARPGGLLDAVADVLATGEPRHFPAMPLAAAGGAAEVNIAPLFDGVVIAWRDAAETERLTALLEQAQWLGRIGTWEENVRTGQVRWDTATFFLFGLPPGHPVPLAALDRHVPAEDVPAVTAFRDRITRNQQAASAAFRIIRADNGGIRQLRAFAEPVTEPGGKLTVVRGAYQDVSDRYHTETAFTLAREQLAGSEQRAHAEHRLSVQLQQAITPQVSHPVEAAGIDVAARYRPASQEHQVGGDWYDAVLLPDKKVLLAVGDVAGHGISAVTGMVALRNYLRGLAITGVGPAVLLTRLNSAAFHLDGTMATVICAIYDPATRMLRWARAGHLPPVVVRGGKARLPTLPAGILVGAGPDAAYREATLRLQLGDTVVLFTDGLIERRDRTLDAALTDLIRFASRPAGDISEFASHLIDEATSDTGDDSCLLVVRIR